MIPKPTPEDLRRDAGDDLPLTRYTRGIDQQTWQIREALAAWMRRAVAAEAESAELAEWKAREQQACIAIAAACLCTGAVPKEVEGTVEAVRAVCKALSAAESGRSELLVMCKRMMAAMESVTGPDWDADIDFINIIEKGPKFILRFEEGR